MPIGGCLSHVIFERMIQRKTSKIWTWLNVGRLHECTHDQQRFDRKGWQDLPYLAVNLELEIDPRQYLATGTSHSGANYSLHDTLTGVAIPVARVTGIALVALGIACWPGPPLVGMLIYSVSVALYLAYVGFAEGLIGVFLWPAVILHVILTALLARDVTRIVRRPPPLICAIPQRPV